MEQGPHLTSDFKKWIVFNDSMAQYQEASDLHLAVKDARSVGASTCDLTSSPGRQLYEIKNEASEIVLQLSHEEREKFLAYIEKHYLSINPNGLNFTTIPTDEPEVSSIVEREVANAESLASPITDAKRWAFFFNRNTFRHSLGYAGIAFLVGQFFLMPQFLDTKLPEWLKWSFIIALTIICHMAVRNYRARFLIGGIRFGTVLKMIISLFGLTFMGLALEVTFLDVVTKDSELNYFAMAGVAVLIVLAGLFTGWLIAIPVYFLNGGKFVTDPRAVKFK